ncbi:MAG: uroporphyrinogen decarboxylase [Clostridia bacterium]|nr:uroporphyrinogen decarboxylase [Clostridia bacterium]
MTNKERVIAAIRFQKPDRVPHNIDFTSRMYERMVEYTGNPNYIDTINNHITFFALSKPDVEVKPGFFMDEFGVVWNRSGVDKDIGVIDRVLLEEPEDLDTYEFPPIDEALIRSTLEALEKTNRDNFKVAGIGFSLFERGWTLRGMENLLCDMIAEPDFVHELLDKITDRLLRILDIALEYDFDCFYFGDDWGQEKGLIMGPAAWRTFIKPRLKKLYDRVHRAGKYVSQHSCGDLREIMDDLCEIGLDIYQTFQPEIYGYEYAEKLYGKITIWGGVSTQRALPMKSPEEIIAITRDMISHFPDGGLIAAPTHAVPFDVPPENIQAMLRVFQEEA